MKDVVLGSPRRCKPQEQEQVSQEFLGSPAVGADCPLATRSRAAQSESFCKLRLLLNLGFALCKKQDLSIPVAEWESPVLVPGCRRHDLPFSGVNGALHGSETEGQIHLL